MMIAISLILLIVLLLIGIPVFYTFFGVTLFLIIFGGYTPSFLFPYGYTQINTVTILALPMFIMAGKIIEKGGMGEHLVDFVNLFFGRIKGGLGIVTVVSCAVFGAISGSATATETVMGSIMMPRMKEAGYDRGKSAALVASACMLGAYIPPSGMMILFGWLTNQSILACFLASVVPGIILIFMFSTWNYFQCRKNPNIYIPPKLPRREKAKQVKHVTLTAIPALLLPFIILGGIYGGVMTPTEAAAVAVLYSIPICLFVYKGVNGKQMLKLFAEAATSTGGILVMLFTVMMISRIYLTEDLPGTMIRILNGLTDNRYIILLLINLFLVFLGMLMDDFSAMTLSAPILLPVCMSIGVSPIQFAVITVVNLGMGCVTPPCAPLLYLGAKVGDTPVFEMIKPTLSLIVCVWIPIIILVSLIPELSLFLPRLILGI